ncbi:FAD-linked oxidase [Rhodobacteraceae bacterium WD3A24]|nr:FAD-linked oxidase [Rhodobacteraceae bacterium WD3A24]
MTALSGWGRSARLDCRVSAPRDVAALAGRVAEGGAIARGAGRAYGDSALSRANTIDMRQFDRMLAFDPATGQLIAEAGVLLGDVIAAFLPRGWFPAVTPGTKFVTLGGAIAADVHGKNHHREGSFGVFVDWIDVMGPDGAVRRCSREAGAETFEWTLGGMGLTGVILRAAIRLRPVATAWIRQTTIPAPCLDAAIDCFEDNLAATYSVAWIDCLGRGAGLGRSLVMLGDHADPGELPADHRAAPFATPRKRRLSVPVDAPRFALNPLSVRAFNALYFRAGTRRAGTALVDWDSYFYPLDAIADWNRIYGRRGFAQFQCVLPLAGAREGLARLVGAISAAGQGSFLSVLKRFGPQTSRFSFPMEGYTLALDFPLTARSRKLMDELDRITLDHGGRFYLAKDSRLSAETLHAADPRAAAFAAMRRESEYAGAFGSAQSDRLGL